MKVLNPFFKLGLVLIYVLHISCDDNSNDIGSNLQIVPKQMLSGNINFQGKLSLIPQMLMAQGGNPDESYTWELDTTNIATPERILIEPTSGIVTLEGFSADSFKLGTSYFRVLVSDGEFINKGMVGLKITDHKLNPVSDVQQMQAADFQLVNGVLDQAYCASLFVMGGTPPYTFLMDSTYTNELEKYGLSLDEEYGLIIGEIPKDAIPRLLSFKVDIKDSKGETALYNPLYKIRVR